MKRKTIIFIIILILAVIIIGGFWFINRDNSSYNRETNNISYFTKDSTIGDVINNEAFAGFGDLIFPLDRSYDLDTTLDDIDDIYVWYNNIDDDTTVNIVNFLKEESGR